MHLRRRLLPLLGAVAMLALSALPAPARPNHPPADDVAIAEAMANVAAIGGHGGGAAGNYNVNADVCPTDEKGRQLTPGERRKLIARGRELFFSTTAFGQEPSGSPTRDGELMSCAACHNGPAFTDGRNNVVGPSAERDTVVRHTPHLLRIADTAPYAWDGRFPCLQAVIKGAIQAELEMNASRVPLQDELDALTAFVETLDAPDAVPGVDFNADLAAIGKELFKEERGTDPNPDSELPNKISCATCHIGDKFTDRDFHKVLVPIFIAPDDPVDPGHVSPTGRIDGFKTPVLRGLRFSQPYFHEGGAGNPTGDAVVESTNPRVGLAEVVATYDRRFMMNLTPLEEAALVEFLLSL